MKRFIQFIKTRKAIFWYRVIICACILIFAGSLTKLVLIFHEYNSASSEYDDVAEDYISEAPEVTGDAVATGDVVAEETENEGGKIILFLNP